MKQNEVVVGHQYNIHLEGKLVRVKVLGDRGYGNGVSRRYQVQRVDTGKVLPAYRTCQALHPIQETNHVGH